MALPHYKLQTPEASTAFPVLLAPRETPPRFAALEQIFRTRKVLIGLEIIAIAAGAALLWLLLDPTIQTPQLLHLLIPAITLGFCLLFFVIIAFVKKRVETEVPDEPDSLLSMPMPAVSKTNSLAPANEFAVEMNLEQWSSEPFQEILDEALIAEVFNDDLVAPDHLVFSLQLA